MSLRKIGVRGKLFGMAGVLLAFSALVGLLSIVNLGSVNDQAGTLYRDALVPSTASATS